MMLETNFRAHLSKTKFCSYFHKGKCNYGDQCAFAHFASELQSTPNLHKTRLCEAFLKGGCQKTDCKFAHGKQELAQAELFHKTTMCSWHEKGKCRYGDRCRFAHGVDELRPPEPHPLRRRPSKSSESVDGDPSSRSETSTDVPDVSAAGSLLDFPDGHGPAPVTARPTPPRLSTPPGLSTPLGLSLGEVSAKPRGAPMLGGTASPPPGFWARTGQLRREPRPAAALEDPFLPVKVYSSLAPCLQPWPYPHGQYYGVFDA